MQGDRYQIRLGDLTVEVVRKRMKTIRLKVHPPDGRVSVSAPHRVSKKAVAEFVIEKQDWIRRTRENVRRRHPDDLQEIISGQKYDVLGVPHILNVFETNGRRGFQVGSEDHILNMYVKPGDQVDTRRGILQSLYRRILEERIPSLIEKWEPVVGVRVAECRFRRMKTRWGSCSIRARRIWLSLELAKKPPGCLEFVLVHEMVHLHERLHNKRFYALMDRFMPDWRVYNEQLKRQGPVD